MFPFLPLRTCIDIMIIWKLVVRTINEYNNNNVIIIIIIIIIILLATTQGMCVLHTASKAVGQRKEFPHQSHSKGPLSNYRFMASSTYKCFSTKRLLLLIHVTNFARCCIPCLQICPVSGAPLVCVRSTFGPSPKLLWEVEITGASYNDQDKGTSKPSWDFVIKVATTS